MVCAWKGDRSLNSYRRLSEAYAINSAGAAVGYVENSADVKTATYWGPKGHATDLNTILGPGWTDTVASGINNLGDIVGSGNYNGLMEAFELIRVKAAKMPYTVVTPEPPPGDTEASTIGYSPINAGGNGNFAGYANPINASGEFVGYAVGNGVTEGVLWSPTGAATVLQATAPTLNAVNASGEIVGEDGVSAATWSSTGTETILPLPSNANNPYGLALGINDKGGVVACEEATLPTGTRGMEGVYWAPGQNPIVLDQGSDPSAQYGATAINNSGVCAGAIWYHATEWAPTGAILWESPDSDGQPSQIMHMNASGTGLGFDGSNAAEWSSAGVETLLANAPGQSGSWANAINASGQAAGFSGWQSGVVSQQGTGVISPNAEAVKWDSTGAVTVLKTPVGDSSMALAINKAGATVGYVENAAGVMAARYWGPTGAVTNLQNLLGPGWSDTSASGINNVGDIVGQGVFNGTQEAWELIRVKAAGAMDSTHYVESHHNVLAASAVHTPVTKSAAHGFASEGHGPGSI